MTYKKYIVAYCYGDGHSGLRHPCKFYDEFDTWKEADTFRIRLLNGTEIEQHVHSAQIYTEL